MTAARELTLAELEQQEAEAQAAAAQATAAAEVLREQARLDQAAELARQETRQHAFDLEWLEQAGARSAELRQAERLALEAFADAAVRSDLGRAWAEYVASRYRRLHLFELTTQKLDQLGSDRPPSAYRVDRTVVAGVTELLEPLQQALADAGVRLALDELDRHDEAREAAARGEAPT